MRRLRFLALLLLLTLLLSSCAPFQPEQKPYTVGVIILLPPLESVLDGIRAGLAEAGYSEGEDIIFLYDGALGSLEAVESTAQRYVDANVDAIISISTPPTQIVKEVTAGTNIPVVFGATDPVGAGLVESLAQPGGNLTGIATGFAEDVRLEWLIRVAPGTKKIYVPYNPEDKSATFALGMATDAAEKLGVEIVSPEIHTTDDITSVMENIPADIDAIFMLPDSLLTSRESDWLQVALDNKLPLSSAGSPPSQLGQLVSYGFTPFDTGKQFSGILIQVLEGADPAELPVEAVEFYLGINLKTAEAIGLEIPDEIIQAADYVIRE